MKNTNVMTMTDAVVARGQRAWGRIKATAAEQRQLWKDIGEALLVGRKLHKSNQGFSQWCKEMGFDDMKPRYRSAAQWLAQNWESVRSITPNTSDPIQLQKDFNDQPKEALPADLDAAELTKTTKVELDQRTAERLAKVSRRSKTNDEGAPIAKRQYEAVAKKHGVTTEELDEAVSQAVPFTYFQFSPDQVKSLMDFKADLIGAYHDLLEEGLTKEAVVALFTNFLNEIQKES
jgi:hypothetical protein